MNLEIEVPLPCVCDVFETNTITEGMSKDVPGGGTIRLRPMPVQKRAMTQDASPYFVIAASVASTVGLGVFSNWLYDRLKGRPRVRHIRINRRTVEVTPDGIRRAVAETVEINES
jgi:hypothetical protein